MTKYYIKKRERKKSVVWIYLNTCIWLSCSFVTQAREKMKLCSDLSGSGYGLHKFSAYPLFSGRLLDSQDKSMKTRQYVYEERITFLVYHIKMVEEWTDSHEKLFVQVFYYFLFKIWTLYQAKLLLHFTLLSLDMILLFSLLKWNGMSASKGVWPQYTS